jgi:hypothetical protein
MEFLIASTVIPACLGWRCCRRVNTHTHAQQAQDSERSKVERSSPVVARLLYAAPGH